MILQNGRNGLKDSARICVADCVEFEKKGQIGGIPETIKKVNHFRYFMECAREDSNPRPFDPKSNLPRGIEK